MPARSEARPPLHQMPSDGRVPSAMELPMPDDSPLPRSRRAFVGGLGQLGLAAVVSPREAGIAARRPRAAPPRSPKGWAPGEGDFLWKARREGAPVGRAVNPPAIGGGFVLQ